MKAIKLFLVSFFVLFVSTVQANGEYIGPAYRAEGGGCAVYVPDVWSYTGSYFIQYSNGNTGHATFKCKLEHESGDQQISYSEFSTDDFPVPGGSCYNTISLEGEKGMWTAQCFGVWTSGD